MTANDSTRVPAESTVRTKAEKVRALTLRPHEVAKLDRDGDVLIVRDVKRPDALGPGARVCRRGVAYPDLWAFVDGNPGDIETWGVVGLPFYCPLGPVGSMLWGREAWSPDHAVFYPNFPYVYKAAGYPAAWEIENGRVYGDETKAWHPFRWLSSTSMPRHASRFPRLRHESCEVKRVRDLTGSDLQQTGMPPSSEEAVLMANRSPDVWLWCSLVRKADVEVANV